MSGTLWWILLFASLNTVVSYGAFSEALCFWSATKISAVLTQVPLVTILLSQLLEMLWPGFARRAPDGWAILGACLVVGGAQLTVLGNGLLDYLRRRVITSYSIHYTKLYEAATSPPLIPLMG